MKKKIFRLLTGSILLFAFGVTACKSTPPAQAVAPAPAPAQAVAPAPAPVVAPAVQAPPVVKPVDSALTALRDKEEALRDECVKYKLDSYLPDDWRLAEASRNAGLSAYGKDYDLATNSFNDAISRYQSIKKTAFDKIRPELEASIISARDSALKAGANDYYPEQFALADTGADKARSLADAGDLAGAYDAGQIALMRYQTLDKGMQIVALKKKIDTNQFAQYSPDDYAQAASKYDSASSAYGTADAAALEAATESVSLYQKVNNAGFKVWTETELGKASDAKSLCDSIKAEKSMKTEYADAVSRYNSATTSGKSGDWEPAYADSTDATTAFASIYQAVSLKKNAADAAILAAKNKQAASASLATQADATAPLPENAVGYSDTPIVIQDTSKGEGAK
jgi:hypothetical protein